MGLFDRFRPTDDEEDTEPGSATEAFDQATEGMVNIGKRTNIIYKHYDVTEDDARLIAELLKKSIEERSIKTSEAIEQIADQVDLGTEQTWELRDTEHTSIHTQHTIENRRTLGMELTFEWNADECSSPICDKVASITTESPAESTDELKTLLRREAEKHPDGTPDRVEHWVPHLGCQSLLLVHTA